MTEESLFAAALEVGPADREAFLDRECPDQELRRRVARLLRLMGGAGQFLERPVVAGPAAEAELPATVAATSAEAGGPGEPLTVDAIGGTRPISEGPGTRVGPYKLLQNIGEGGMGAVYMAEQERPVRRKVALKVIKPGMDSDQVVARFEAERQALAMMDHPNIARVLDAGVTDSGRPYFVMELVKGVPITDYCDQNRLTTRQRLELFVSVCQAIQHAHQKGVIHRDVKPSNVLVTLYDGRPVPKVIDFGVAKAVEQRLTERTLFTQFGSVVGTLEYMSPEQAGMSALDVDTRSDVYSLGVLLYELLTGTTPLERGRLRDAAYGEILRRIKEEVTPKPSTRLSASGDKLASIAATRGSEPARLARAVRGDLDWVVMRALEKDRTRRYESAGGFARDVERYLAGDAVEAGPPSVRYRFGKLVRRHRAGLTTAALLGLALVGCTAVSLWQLVRARDAAAAAAARADETKQVVDYLVKDVFGAAVPGKRSGRAVTVGELMDHADATVGDHFRRQPLVEASVRMALARTYRSRIEGARALPHAARATELRVRHLGPDHPETLAALAEQALAYHPVLPPELERDGYTDKVRRVFEAHRRVLGPAHAETLRMQLLLAGFLSRLERHDEARAEAVEAEALAVRALGPDHPVTLSAWVTLGWTAFHCGDGAGAEVLMRRGFEGLERVLGPLDPETVAALDSRALLEINRGRSDTALPLKLEEFRRRKALNGICDKSCQWALSSILVLLRQRRDFVALRDFCEAELRGALVTPEEADPYVRPRYLLLLDRLIAELSALPESVERDRGLFARAVDRVIAIGERADAESEAGLVPDRDGTFQSALPLAKAYRATGRWQDAAALVERTLERGKVKPGGDVDTLESLGFLTSVYDEAGQLGRAERVMREELAFRQSKEGPRSVAAAGVLAALGRNLLRQGKYAAAEPLLRDCLAIREAKMPDDWLRFNTLSMLGGALLGRHDYAASEPLILAGYEGLRARAARIPQIAKARLTEAGERVVQLYEAWGKTEQAAAWRTRLGLADLPADVFAPP